jgi:hypothetical protein
MTREQIIQMAREAGMAKACEEAALFWYPEIERFAALVSAASASVEREACAKVCEDYTDNDSGKFIDHEGHGYECAAVIRARGLSE